MSHDHKHKHCAHAHLAFCQPCQLVYCHDCSQEWTPKCTWIWPNTYGGSLTYGTTTGTYPSGTVLCNEKAHTHGGG